MSAEMLRKNVIDRLEQRNAEVMNIACAVRPSPQTTADGLALTVVDNLAMARAFAICTDIINKEYAKLVSPRDATEQAQPIRGIY